MLIKTLQFKEHPQLGDLFLDFSGPDGRPYPVVVIAGENGAGKSRLLHAIGYQLLGGGGYTLEAELVLSPDELAMLQSHFPVQIPSPHPAPAFLPGSEEPISNPVTIRSGPLAREYLLSNGRSVSVAYTGGNWALRPLVLSSPPEVDFSTDGTLMASEDPSKLDQQDLLMGGKLGGLISKMLVELRRADSMDVLEWVEQNRGLPVPEEVLQGRFARFQKAFQILMPRKRLVGLTSELYPQAQFVELGRTTSIRELSSGEKQIVFRGGHFLRYRGILGGAILVIDEPELSLHPDWQKRIIPFFQAITRQPDGSHPQLIIATHSPFIVHGAVDARVIILEKDDAGQVREATNPTFPASREAVAVGAFGLEGFMAAARRDQVVVLTEGESDAILINHAWEKLRHNQPKPFTALSINGARTLNTMMQNAEAMVGAGGRVLGLFDYDQEGHGQWKGAWGTALPLTGSDATGLTKTHASGRARVMLLPVPSFRSSIAGQQLGSRSFMSIELLFRDQDLPSGMTEELPLPGGMKIVTIKSHRKVDFAKATKDFSAEQFASFEPILAAIVDLAR